MTGKQINKRDVQARGHLRRLVLDLRNLQFHVTMRCNEGGSALHVQDGRSTERDHGRYIMWVRQGGGTNISVL